MICQIVKGQSIKSKYDSLFNYLKVKDDFNGNILIADQGKVVYQKSIGYRDFAKGRLLNANTIFNLASLSKQFTATAIMMLAEQGKLNLEDKLEQHVPTLSMYKDITIRNLLTHTSGIPDYMDLFAKYWNISKVAQNEDVIELLANYHPPIHFDPGENWEYSNTGYVLLACILEKVSGLSYAEFLRKNIFDPLKMNCTLVYNTRISKNEIISNYALGYVIDSAGKKPVVQDSIARINYVLYLDGIVGDGGINSTTVDLFKWDRALYTNKLLTSKPLEEMFTPVKLKNGKKAGYGFGWGIVTHNKETGKYLGHNGSWGGYDTHIERFIERDKTIIVLRNIQNKNSAAGVYEAYIDILFNNAFKLPTIIQH